MVGGVISVDHPDKTALICSWVYTRKVSEDHHPCFIRSQSYLENLRTMAPSAMRYCVPRW